MEIYPINNFTIENPNIIVVEQVGQKLVIRGQSTGQTNLIVWTAEGIQIFSVFVSFASKDLLDPKRLPDGSLRLGTEVSEILNNSGFAYTNLYHSAAINYPFSRSGLFSGNVLASKSGSQPYNVYLRSLYLKYLYQQWGIQVGEIEFEIPNWSGLQLHGANITYDPHAKDSSSNRYSFAISGGSVAQYTDNYLKINNFISNNKAIGARTEITGEDFELKIGGNAWYSNNWTSLITFEEHWNPSGNLSINSGAVSFRGKNKANLKIAIPYKSILLLANYDFTQEGFQGFEVYQSMPLMHKYNISLSEKLSQRLTLFQNFQQSFSRYSSPTYSQKGDMLNGLIGTHINFDNTTISASFMHNQSLSEIINQGNRSKSKTYLERISANFTSNLNKNHRISFAPNTTFEKSLINNSYQWRVRNNIDITHSYNKLNKYKISSSVGYETLPDSIEFSDIYLSSIAKIIIKRNFEIDGGLKISSYKMNKNFPRNTNFNESFSISYPVGKYIRTFLKTSMSQNISSSNDTKRSGSISGGIYSTIPLKQKVEKKSMTTFSKEKIHKHKIIAVLDKNESLSFDKEDSKIRGLVFVIEGKKYKTGGDGSFTFESESDTVEAELIKDSIPSKIQLLNPTMINTILLIDRETYYYFGAGTANVIIKGFIDSNGNGVYDPDVDLSMENARFIVADDKTKKEILSGSISGGWSVISIPSDIERIKVSLDQSTLSSTFEQTERTIEINKDQNNEVIFVTQISYALRGGIDFIGWNTDEIANLKNSILVTIGEKTVPINSDNSFSIEQIEPGTYEAKITGVNQNAISPKSILIHKVTIKNKALHINLPRFKLIRR